MGDGNLNADDQRLIAPSPAKQVPQLTRSWTWSLAYFLGRYKTEGSDSNTPLLPFAAEALLAMRQYTPTRRESVTWPHCAAACNSDPRNRRFILFFTIALSADGQPPPPRTAFLPRFTGLPGNPTCFSSRKDSHGIVPHTTQVIPPTAQACRHPFSLGSSTKAERATYSDRFSRDKAQKARTPIAPMTNNSSSVTGTMSL